MVEKFKERFQELREDYKVTKNPGEDFVFLVYSPSSAL